MTEDNQHEPQQPAIDAMIEGVEQMLASRADDRLLMERQMMQDLRSSADFTRAAVNALQVNHGCFDQSSVDEVTQLNDVAIRIFTIDEIEDVADALIEGDPLDHSDVMRRFASGLTGLHTLLSSPEIASSHHLLDLASQTYNATFVCLAALLPAGDDEKFERVVNDLEFYLAPMAVGVLEFDENGLTVAPEKVVTIQDTLRESVIAVHNEFEERLSAMLPPHDSKFKFLMLAVMNVNSVTESYWDFRKNPDITEEVMEKVMAHRRASTIEGYVSFGREKYYPAMPDETADPVKELMGEYIDRMLATVRLFE